MTAPDTVFAFFVEANPVPDESAMSAAPPPANTVVMQPQVSRTASTTRAPLARRGMLVAVATFAAVAVLGALWLIGPARNRTSEPASPEELMSRRAIAAVEAIVTARNEGDVDRVLALSTPAPASGALSARRVQEFQAGFAAAGMPTLVRSCETTVAPAVLVAGECLIELTDPVAAELGAAEQVAPFRFENGLVTTLEYRGDSLLAVNRAYSEYLRSFFPEEYSTACQPGAYEPGSIVQSELLALTGECAAVAAPLADEVAEWIRAGRPGS